MSDHSAYDGSVKLWIGGLPLAATSADLQLHFSQVGEPLMCEVTKKGEGVAVYSSAEEAHSAAEAFNKTEIGGKAITTIIWSKKMGPLITLREKGAGAGGNTGGGKGKGWGGDGWGAAPMGCFPMWGPSPMDMMMMGMWGMDPYSMAAKGGFKGMPMDKGTGKGKSAPASWEESASPLSSVHYQKLELPVNSLIVQQGLLASGPAVEWAKDQPIFNSVVHLLNKLLVQDAAQVEHDADWEKYPDIGRAWQNAAGEEQCFAVAFCPSLGLWGVGVAQGWKGREQAAKLALAMAVHDVRPLAKDAQWEFPDFMSLCRQTIKRGWAGGMVYASSGDCPTIKEITVPQNSNIVLGGCTAEGIALLHEGKTAKEWFCNAHNILGELVENVAEEVEFQDDPDIKQLPEVLQAWKEKGGDDQCLCVAKHAGLGLWGCGLAAGWKFREGSAKLALAIAIARGKGILEELMNSGNYPELGDIVAALNDGPASKKRRKW